jgi:hypothetical protein
LHHIDMRQRSHRRTRLSLLVGALVGVLLLALPPASAVAAPTTGSASVSDTTPLPGDVVTVRASGLQAGKPATIEYQPGAVMLATLTVDGDGGFTRNVQIPPRTTDGAKQIVVKSIGTNGRFTRIQIDLQVAGPPATARLSDDTLVPKEAFRFDGSRFAAGTSVVIVVYPEGAILGQPNAGPDGRFSVDVRMPELLLNGKHGFIVAGLAAGGHVAVLKLYATVTGGVGGVVKGDPLDEVDYPYVTPTSAPTTSLVRRPTSTVPLVSGDSGGSGLNTLGLAILVAFVLILVVLAVAWWRSSEGQRWLRDRAERRRIQRQFP